MKFKKAILALCVILLIACLVSNCGRNEETHKNDLIKITIAQWGQEKYLIYLPLYIAIEQGFFKEQGVEASLKFSGNDDQTFATVIKGDAQFGVGDPIFTAISRERGFRGKVVSSIVNGVAIWGVTNNKGMETIESPDDLKGLRVGTFPSPSTNYTLMKRTIKDGGENLKSTRIIEAPIGSQLALLEAGEADIAMELEPSTSIAVSKGYLVVYSSPKFYGPFAFTGLTTTEEYIDNNSAIVEKVVNALEQAMRYAHENRKGTIDIACSLFPSLDRNVVEMAVMRMLDEQTIPTHTLVTDEAWQKALQVRLEVGDLKKPQPTNESVDNRFAEKAMNKVVGGA